MERLSNTKNSGQLNEIDFKYDFNKENYTLHTFSSLRGDHQSKLIYDKCQFPENYIKIIDTFVMQKICIPNYFYVTNLEVISGSIDTIIRDGMKTDDFVVCHHN